MVLSARPNIAIPLEECSKYGEVAAVHVYEVPQFLKTCEKTTKEEARSLAHGRIAALGRAHRHAAAAGTMRAAGRAAAAAAVAVHPSAGAASASSAWSQTRRARSS